MLLKLRPWMRPVTPKQVRDLDWKQRWYSTRPEPQPEVVARPIPRYIRVVK